MRYIVVLHGSRRPVLRHRAVLMTITSIEDDQIRINVIPNKLKDGENNALTTPLTITGTAEELDAELSQTLVSFVGSHLQLKNTLATAKADMDAADKAAQAEARSKTKTQQNKEAITASGPKRAEVAQPAEPTKPPAPKTASLFDLSPTPVPAAEPVAAALASESEEEEILAEIGDNDEEPEGELDEAA